MDKLKKVLLVMG